MKIKNSFEKIIHVCCYGNGKKTTKQKAHYCLATSAHKCTAIQLRRFCTVVSNPSVLLMFIFLTLNVIIIVMAGLILKWPPCGILQRVTVNLFFEFILNRLGPHFGPESRLCCGDVFTLWEQQGALRLAATTHCNLYVWERWYYSSLDFERVESMALGNYQRVKTELGFPRFKNKSWNQLGCKLPSAWKLISTVERWRDDSGKFLCQRGVISNPRHKRFITLCCFSVWLTFSFTPAHAFRLFWEHTLEPEESVHLSFSCACSLNGHKGETP